MPPAKQSLSKIAEKIESEITSRWVPEGTPKFFESILAEGRIATIRYQDGTVHELPRAVTEAYLAWLEAGNYGPHTTMPPVPERLEDLPIPELAKHVRARLVAHPNAMITTSGNTVLIMLTTRTPLVRMTKERVLEWLASGSVDPNDASVSPATPALTMDVAKTETPRTQCLGCANEVGLPGEMLDLERVKARCGGDVRLGEHPICAECISAMHFGSIMALVLSGQEEFVEVKAMRVYLTLARAMKAWRMKDDVGPAVFPVLKQALGMLTIVEGLLDRAKIFLDGPEDLAR